MFELFILFAVFLLGWVLGQIHAIARATEIIEEYTKSNGLNKTKPIITISILKIERIKDILYLYDVATDSFICQASTLDALAAMVKESKNIKLAGVIYDEDKLWFVDGKVFNTLEEVSIDES